ncbi:MAG: 50S ribosomal protein L6 [Patescibacteria group bacterium]
MSRIGKKPIPIPEGVSIAVSGSSVTVKGPKGTLERPFRSEISIEVNGKEARVSPKRETKFARALWGTYASHIKNMIEGTTRGFVKKLEVQGIGYKAAVQGDSLVMSLGFSHPVSFKAPEGVAFGVEKNIITVSGIDKEKVGMAASEIRALKKPEPYKGKGIRYVGEVVRRKAGKKATGQA